MKHKYERTYMQQAYLMKDSFTKEQLKIVDEYIDTLWKNMLNHGHKRINCK